VTGDPTLRVLSLGGGTQSCALALKSAAGELPRLDAVIFADTQGEMPETYRYLDYLSGVLDEAGIPFYRVTAGSLEEALLSEVPTSSNPTPPVHVKNPDGSKGRVGHYRCSYDYKRSLVERQIKQLCGGRGAWKRSTVEQWIGFSKDEAKRMKQSEACRCGHPRVIRKKRGQEYEQVHTAEGCSRCKCSKFDPWLINRWPLIELDYDRADTIGWFGANGHPTPPRSACWFCPNSSDDRWRDLRDNHPDLWERACALDDANRTGGGFRPAGVTAKFAGEMYWHATLVSLRSADLRTRTEREHDAGIFSLFDDAEIESRCDESGACFT
jgi:hypothetical protein